MDFVTFLTLVSSLISLVLSLFNLIIFRRQVSLDRPIIYIRKLRRSQRLPHPTNNQECAFKIQIKNRGYRETSLNKVVVIINPINKIPFSTNVVWTSEKLPLEISPLKVKDIDIWFSVSKRMMQILKQDLPIKINVRFLFTHTEIVGRFLIGRKGLSVSKMKNPRHLAFN